MKTRYIIAYFRDGNSYAFTYENSFHLLTHDPDVVLIIDENTSETLYKK